MRDDSNYLDALQEVSSQSKASVAIASVPLGIVLVQLRYLSAVENIWLQSVSTIAVVSLFLATVLAWILAMMIQATYAMELYRRDDIASEKGQMYMRWVINMAKNRQAYTEVWVLEVSKLLVLPFWLLAGLGYLMLMIMVVSLIWTSP